ncbi:hypothetical protein [Streptomyces milbemycinicus]|uniref:DUF2304 domain-containing protein n=1 Tax=Streptomyces milbemycinicus TaxID=476552 RepID=A0ABW8LK11_9ACTN
MVVSLSTVVLLGIVVIAMIRQRVLGPGAATIAALFGFCLASTGLAPTINEAIASISAELSRIA